MINKRTDKGGGILTLVFYLRHAVQVDVEDVAAYSSFILCRWGNAPREVVTVLHSGAFWMVTKTRSYTCSTLFP